MEALRPLRAKKEQQEAVDFALLNAPRLLAKFSRDDGWDRVTFRNERPSSAVNITVQPIVETERHPVETIPASVYVSQDSPEQFRLLVTDRRTGIVKPLVAILGQGNEKTEHAAMIHFENTDGIGFSQTFTLIKEVDGSVTWAPGPVRMRSNATMGQA